MKNVTSAPPLSKHRKEDLRRIALDCILDLDDEQGIIASARSEAYGCLFGRDSAITVLKLLEVHKRQPHEKILDLCKRTLLTHHTLQGESYNIESGEEPGKYVHEYRPSNYERLTQRPRPWYIYDDGRLRNYDSVDATPLLMQAMHEYYMVTGDTDFLNTVLPGVIKGLQWLLTDADKDQDFLIEYELPSQRISGGLVVQSWTDSIASLTQLDGSFPIYPIAAVEVQAIAWKCIKTWAEFFKKKSNPEISPQKLLTFASKQKEAFREHFLFEDSGYTYAAQAVDGKKRAIKTITSNPLLCLWASRKEVDKKVEAIIDAKTVEDFVNRGFMSDLFDPLAGLRTMSRQSPLFDPSVHSYHNGSFWPMLNGLIHEGLHLWGYEKEAKKLENASLEAIAYFNSPIELYCSVSPGEYHNYRSPSGKRGCLYQAWTAASMLNWLTP